MELIFIGTGTGVPDLQRRAPAILVKLSDTTTILIDCGPGTLYGLKKYGWHINQIDFIVLTHLHVDHVNDIAHFIFASKYPLELREKKLSILGPPKTKEFFDSLCNTFGKQIKEHSFEVEIKEATSSVGCSVVKRRNWEITSFPLKHTQDLLSLGFKITQNSKVIVICGDTEYTPIIHQIGKLCDLLILECSFPLEYEVEGHLNPKSVCKIAKEVNPKKLILTHFYPLCNIDEIRSYFEENRVEVTFAYDGLKLTLE